MFCSAGITSFVKSGQIHEMGSKNFTREFLHPPYPICRVSFNGSFADDGCYLLTLATAEIATTIMASCIPVLRVLFRDLRDVTPTEISGTFGLEHYHYPKSNSTGETVKKIDHGPVAVETAAPAANGNGDNTQAPSQSGLRRSQTSPKTWRGVWDVGKSSRPRSKSLARGSPAADENRVPPDVQADNSSQRVLVCVSGRNTPPEEATTEGVIVQTRKIGIKYEGRRPCSGSSGGYEMDRIEIGGSN